MNYAGFWKRLVAHLIDFVLLNGVELGLEYGISGLLGLSSMVQQVLGFVLSLVLIYFYYCWYPVKKGTTIGKKLFSIYVVDAKTGEIFSSKQAVIRTLGYLPSYAMIGCGFLMAAFHPEKRTFHDLLAGTVCIIKPKAVSI